MKKINNFLNISSRLKYFIIFLNIVFIFSLLFLSISLQPAFAAENSYIIPNLNVPIPGLDFTKYPITLNAGKISVPFLAAYILNFYKLITGIGCVTAAIMFVYGGYLYLLGATGLQVQDAKKKMIDAIVGLTILLGSYLILININPQTVTLKSIDIEHIPTKEEIIQLMATNPYPTSPEGVGTQNAQIIPDPPVPEGKPIVAGKCTSIMAVEKDKLNTFVMSQLRGQDYGERIIQAADILADCHISLQSCGQVVMRTMAIAGVGPTGCLTDPRRQCWIKSKNYAPSKEDSATKYIYQVIGFNGQQRTQLYGLLCKGSVDCLNKKGMEKYFRSSDYCKTDMRDAIAEARRKLEAVPLKDGGTYPKKFTDLLQPGDWITSYSANIECDGLHSQIFLGWVEGKPGVAKIFDGSMSQLPRIRERCFDKRCENGNYNPIVDISRPKPEMIRPNPNQ